MGKHSAIFDFKRDSPAQPPLRSDLQPVRDPAPDWAPAVHIGISGDSLGLSADHEQLGLQEGTRGHDELDSGTVEGNGDEGRY